MQCGKLWFRGGCYKFFQLLLLLVPTVVWGVAGFFVTAAGVGMNTPYVNTVVSSAAQFVVGLCNPAGSA